MEETALPRRSSTLPPPPLANGTSATRALQRFDLGRLRSTNRLALTEPTEPTEPLVRTTRMSVPASIRFLEPQVQAPAAASVVDAKGVAHWVAPFRAVAWALAAGASFVGAGSLVTVLVYALLFP